MVQTEGIAHGQHPLADSQLVRIAKGQHGKVIEIDLDDGKICAGIQSDDLRLRLPFVRQLNGQFLCVFHHVVVRHDVAVFRHDHPGSQPLERPRPLIPRRSAAEKLLEGVPEPLLRLRDRAFARYEYNGRLDPLRDGGEGLAEFLHRPLVRGDDRCYRPVLVLFDNGGVPVGNEQAAEYHARDEQRRAGEASYLPFLRHARSPFLCCFCPVIYNYA